MSAQDYQDGYRDGREDGCPSPKVPTYDAKEYAPSATRAAYVEGYDEGYNWGYNAGHDDAKAETPSLSDILAGAGMDRLKEVTVRWDEALKRWVVRQGNVERLVARV